jgi:anti-anti-sigma factor
MANELKITTEQVPGMETVTVIHLNGWLDKKSEERFYESAQRAYEQGTRQLILDMSGVDTLTSAGMRALTQVYKLYTPQAEQYKDKNTHVTIYGAPEHITHVLGITGFLKYIPNYENMQAALDSFNE